jgi:lipopolysaccharide/colanic/teichoic acid biosynthesis glycosyltransferase
MRIIDISISICALLFLMPLFAIIITLLKCTGEGEIFFKQKRVGQFGKSFKVIKFATMLKDSPNIGSGTITSKNDPRILPVGKFLRKTKINELPQFLNVLYGEMSLIGPRPHAKRDLNGVPSEILEELLKLKPGLSGIGSIVFRNEEGILNTFDEPRPFYDKVIAPYKADLEMWYAQNKSLYLNVQLIIITIRVVMNKRSVNVYDVFAGLPNIPQALKPFLAPGVV